MLIWRKRRPRTPDPTRPAIPLAWRLIELGSQVRPARYELDAVCDDGTTRTFITGPDGRWLHKKGTSS